MIPTACIYSIQFRCAL